MRKPKMPSKKLGRPVQLPEPWLSLAIRVGKGEPNVAKLIADLNTARRTFYNWVNEINTPSKAAKAGILKVFKTHGIEPPESLHK